MLKKLSIFAVMCFFSGLFLVKNANAESQNNNETIKKELITFLDDVSAFQKQPEYKKTAICIGISNAAMNMLGQSVVNERMLSLQLFCYEKEYPQISKNEMLYYVLEGKAMGQLGMPNSSSATNFISQYCGTNTGNVDKLNSCMERTVKGY